MKLKDILLIISSSVILTSCNYLDVVPSEIPQLSDAFKNEATAQNYIMGNVYGYIYNPQIQISVVSGTKRSIFRQKNKTKRSKKRLHTTLIKPEQKVNEDLCSGFIVS